MFTGYKGTPFVIGEQSRSVSFYNGERDYHYFIRCVPQDGEKGGLLMKPILTAALFFFHYRTNANIRSTGFLF